MNEAGPDGRSLAARRRGLGMGLSALLGAGAEVGPLARAENPRSVPIELLYRSRVQPRRQFDQAELEALAESIRAKGVLQPLLVRPMADNPQGFEIVAGERRWRAAQMAGLHELPVIIYQLADREALEVALLENVQRQDLNPLEEAEGYRRLIDEFGHTQDALASALGKSRSHIANLLRLLGLPEVIRAMLERGELSAGHARALLTARDPLALARMVVDGALNVRQTEALVRADTTCPASQPLRPARDADTAALERDLSQRLGLGISLRPKGTGGTLTITYRSLDQLDALLKRLS